MSMASPLLIPSSLPSPPPTPAPPEVSLTTQERLRLAKRRRAAQLRRWSQREKPPDLLLNTTDSRLTNASPRGLRQASNKEDISNDKQMRRGISFVSNIMLLEAAARNDLNEVRQLLEAGVSPNATNEDGLTALHQCCIDDSQEMMRLLLSFNGDPNAVDTEKWTPLHAAATCGHLHLVKFLIEHDADLLAVNADGNMPYDLCEDETTLSYIENEMARRGVTQELIDTTRATTERKMLNDLINAQSSDAWEAKDQKTGATPLHIASANGYLSVVEFLLDQHCSTEVVDDDLWQPIHAAACWGQLEVVELLAQNGANVSAKTRNGETPFDVAEDPEIRERLVQLKEQRFRLDQPRVRRSRSASTRTQSIRRTSLREKMNTTRRDVQDEKLFFIHSFDATAKNEDESNDNVNNDNEMKNGSTVLVSKEEGRLDESEVEPPQPPPRLHREGSSLLPSSSSSDKINIHVSVTINTPSTTTASTASGPTVSTSSSSSQPSTLADLKKARSQSRSITTPALLSSSPPPLPPRFSSPSETRSREPFLVDQSNNNGGGSNNNMGGPISGNFKRYSATTSDVVGPKKRGCCSIS